MNLLSPRREIGEFKKRYKWMALVVLIFFAVLTARAIQLQVIEHDHYARIAQENITKTIVLPATRGVIRDAADRIIATNLPSYSVFITPQHFDVERDISLVGEYLGLSAEERADLRQRVLAVPAHRRTHQVEMFRNISREQLAALETHSTELGGVDVVAKPMRSYPYGTLASHAIGYMNEVSADDLQRISDQGYRAGDVIGRMGVELAWESSLRGRRGVRRMLVDVRGQETEVDERNLMIAPSVEPVPGRDLTLTVDMELMRVIDRAFRGQPSGSVAVVEVKTGRVRALFSKPSYDLNEMSGHLTHERYQELSNNPFRPLIDKTLYETYFPGSTFKPITALAALQGGGVDPATRVHCPGYYEVGTERKRCTQAHGDVDMHQALVRSCNVYFWWLAEKVGLERLNQWGWSLGLGEPTGIGINGEASGFLATREWYEARHGRFRVGFTLNTAIGQGNTRVTVLQLTSLYAALANHGRLYVPQIVERVSAPDGTVIEEFSPRLRRQIDIDPLVLQYLQSALVGVVNASEGTAHGARIEGGVEIAGKTGTAQVSRRPLAPGEDPRRAWYFNRDHAWFAGFAPADDPEVAIVVLVEHGGAGGRNAAPIATQILQEYLGEASGETTTAGAPSEPPVVAHGRVAEVIH